MIEITGNLWDYPEPVIRVITTNGTVRKDGCAVMGRGCALEAAQFYPELPYILGDLISNYGNVCHWLKDNLISFPVKHNWWEKADVSIIEKSCKELSTSVIAKRVPIVLPRPGCGNGKLRWEDVKPILEKYFVSDQYKVISYD